MPALSLPLLHGENGLPLGVQLVGRRGDDARGCCARRAGWQREQLQVARWQRKPSSSIVMKLFYCGGRRVMLLAFRLPAAGGDQAQGSPRLQRSC
jgi:hypothetical protein